MIIREVIIIFYIKYKEYHHPISTDMSDDNANDSMDKSRSEMNRTTYLDVIDSLGNEYKPNIQVFGTNIHSKNPIKIGNSYSFLYIKNTPLITLGPQCNINILHNYLVYMSFILLAIINLANLGLCYFVYPNTHIVIKYIGLIIYLIQNSSQLYCTMINPGIPSRNNYLSEEVIFTMYRYMKENNIKFDKYRVCGICNILVFIEQQVIHCEDCNICVEGKLMNYI
jgi:hypothetical protein